jgi:L-asparaginase
MPCISVGSDKPVEGRKKIILLTTGGTIASAPTAEGLAPLGSAEILEHLGRTGDEFALTVREILRLDSPNIQPEEWRVIASAIYECFDRFDGVVVAHGTDTMAYTASMMCFMLRNPPIPVVFTGSQLPISHPLTDALVNLQCAFAMAASGIPGVFVAFNRKIIVGCRAVKIRTTGFDAFESINVGCAGTVGSDGLRFNKEVLPVADGPCALEDSVDANVFLLKLTPGTNPDVVDMLLDSNCHGIVIEAFGAGGLQFVRRDFVSKLERAAFMGIPVVVCSQCLYERSDFSLYQVGQKALEKGAIQAFDMTSEAAITKLMWALGRTRNADEIRKLFALNLAGEIAL